MEKISTIFGFYIPFLAENLKVFENLGGGMFLNISLEEEMAEADENALDLDSDGAGMVYAYSFPTIVKPQGRFPIKGVGSASKGSASCVEPSDHPSACGCS